jgi:formamidopyrimidine-DNA glycosylase
MPELPEVQTVCDGIKNFVVGARIIKAKIINKKLRIEIPKSIEKLAGAKIQQVRRKAKYIILELDNKKLLIIHLGMSGRLTVDQNIIGDYYHKKTNSQKHDHLKIILNNGFSLTYNDTRKFGLIDLIDSNQESSYKYFKHLGCEPLSEKFTKQALEAICKSRTKNIKATIMDASLIVGVGNIYACEALFRAKILPERPAKTLSASELERLRKAIISTLEDAIKAGGSTIQDYANPNGEAGYFQHSFLVYDKENQECKICKNKIIRVKDSGRSTYYCTKCQK